MHTHTVIENFFRRMKMESKCFILNTGDKIPAIGLGTWTARGENVCNAIKAAIDSGYRHIDTAYMYQNEIEIGLTIKSLIESKQIKRRELFISSKLWNTFHRSDLVRAGFFKSLNNLNLNYLDLYLVHTPCANDSCILNDSSNPIQRQEASYIAVWRELINLFYEGFIRNIGVANFNEAQLEDLINKTGFIPAVLQVECHPFLSQVDLRNLCHKYGIHITAHSPLGSPGRLNMFTGEPNLFQNKTIRKVAKIYKKTIAQILLRYQLQLSNSAIPKSIQKTRIAENFDVFDFTLVPEHMDMLNKLNYERRFCPLLE